MRAVYLTGELVYLRALQSSDKDQATAWFPSHYPSNAASAEVFLKETHQKLSDRTSYYAIVRIEGDEVVGGVTIWTNLLQATVKTRTAPWLDDAGAIRADALRVLVPWLRDEMEVMNATFDIAADDSQSIAAAEALGLRPGTRLRQWIARPDHRVDLLWYEALRPHTVIPPDEEGHDA